MRKIKLIIALALSFVMLMSTFAYGAEISFDLSGQIGNEVSDKKSGSLKPFVSVYKSTDPQSYISNTMVQPVFRVRFDEGAGSTVTDEISGNSFNISGDDYEWIDNADLRYGGLGATKNKQEAALKLNDSYISLGDLSSLADTMTDGFTFAFWTNYEIIDKADNGYTEPAHLQYSGVISRGRYDTSYKYDMERYNVLLQSDNTKLGFQKTAFALNSYKTNVPGPVMYNDFYNMYFVVVDKNADGEWQLNLHANDRCALSTANRTVLTDWSPENVFSGNLYIGTPGGDSTYGSPQLGIADMMIFDKPLTYQERLEVFYGYRQAAFYKDSVPTE